MSPDETIWASRRTSERRLRLGRRTYRGRSFLDLRIEYLAGEEWTPTRNGFALPARELAPLRDALDGLLSSRGAREASAPS